MKSKLLVIMLMILSDSLLGQDTTKNYFVLNNPEYAKTDTVKCLFLEVVKTDSVITKWTSGFIVRSNGMITFSTYRMSINVTPFRGDLNVDAGYLPITSGIVKSKVLYKNMQPVSSMVIQIILTGEQFYNKKYGQ